MSTHLYAGPFIKTDRPIDIPALTDERLMDITSGHNQYIPGNVCYCIPNITLADEPKRQFVFERTDDTPVFEAGIDGQIIIAELHWFQEGFKAEIAAIIDADPSARVGWGIVPYWL